MAEALTRVLAELRRLDVQVTAEELCEALWLCQQGMPLSAGWPAAARGAVPSPQVPGGPQPRRTTQDTRHDPELSHTYLPEQLADQAAGGEGVPRTLTPIGLPDSPALPHARDLARALRPLRYDPRRTYRADGIDEAATAGRIAQAGIRVPVWRTTRRRRLDLDLVLDLGGSGPLWEQLAAELRTMLEIQGAFRSVRFWTLDSDSADLPLRVGYLGPGPASAPGVPHPWDAVCPAPRKPVVMVLTDGTGRCWQTKQVYGPLRKWAAYGTVALVQMLSADMWDRTASRALPVMFFPTDDGYHSGARIDVDDADLSAAGLARDDLPAATAIPVIGLDVPWLRSWLPLLRGAQAGAVPGYALLIPARDCASQPAGPVEELLAADAAEPLTAEQRVQRFVVNASGNAVRLARLLSVVGAFNLNVMRKIQHKLLPGAKPPVMAEVLLGGLVYWTSPTGITVPSGTIEFKWYRGVPELLRERPEGEVELARDHARVTEALGADSGTWREYAAVDVGPGGDSSIVVAADAEPLFPPPEARPRSAPPKGRPGPVGPPAEPGVRPVRIGIWGSTQSGRTTFLTVLASIGLQQGRGDEFWQVRPANEATKRFVGTRFTDLAVEKKFPDPTLPLHSEQLSFRLERRRAQGPGLLRWLRPERVAEITVELQDRAGDEFGGDSRQESANSYLASSDVLVFFFDPTYDDPYDVPKWHSLDFFLAVEAHLAMSAARQDALYGRFLPQHIAVCIPKLDDQRVFNAARLYGCAETDPDTGLPWVPTRLAGRFFQKICADQHRDAADYLLNRILRSFHPERISFHALSSVGFWIPESGEFDPRDVCNVSPVPRPEEGDSTPERRVRGKLRPLHVLDPLTSLVERAEKDQ